MKIGQDRTVQHMILVEQAAKVSWSQKLQPTLHLNTMMCVFKVSKHVEKEMLRNFDDCITFE